VAAINKATLKPITLKKINQNKMKKIFSMLTLAVMILSVSSLKSFAQTDEIQLIQSMWGIEKREIVKQYMALSEAEATAFWPVYDAYQEEYKALGKERLMIISDYADNLATITNEKADELALRLLKNNASVDKLQSKYYAKFKKVIPATRAVQFMQLDTYLQTMIRAEIQNNIPFIGELDRKMK
jgi:hypothetical protein